MTANASARTVGASRTRLTVGGEVSSSKTPVPGLPAAPVSASRANWARTNAAPPAGRLKTAVPAP